MFFLLTLYIKAKKNQIIVNMILVYYKYFILAIFDNPIFGFVILLDICILFFFAILHYCEITILERKNIMTILVQYLEIVLMIYLTIDIFHILVSGYSNIGTLKHLNCCIN